MKRYAAACIVALILAGIVLPGVAYSAGTWTSCSPVEIMTHSDRVHVKCATSVGGGIRYFAVSTTNTTLAARVLSVISTARVSGNTLTILYESLASSNPSGCATTDCRLLYAVGF